METEHGEGSKGYGLETRKKVTLAEIERGAKVAGAEEVGNPYLCNISAPMYINIWRADAAYSAGPQGRRGDVWRSRRMCEASLTSVTAGVYVVRVHMPTISFLSYR